MLPHFMAFCFQAVNAVLEDSDGACVCRSLE